MNLKIWRRLWLAALLLTVLGVRAAPISEEERQSAFRAAEEVARSGPQDIDLAAKAQLHLPAGYRYVGQPQAQRLLHVMGNPGDDPQLQGLIFPADAEPWLMIVRYEDSGHIKDDEARDWNADELLQRYRDGTEAANAERAELGAAPLEVIGWAEQPGYDAATHRLVWAMISRHKGAPADAPQGVNYNTYALGREGYFSLNLVTDLEDLARYRPVAGTLLAALDYQPGQRYGDYNASTDRTAEYGLAALVVGVAAKKLGLLAVLLAFLAKFAKVIFIGLAAGGGLLSKVFKRRQAAAATVAAPAPAPAAAAPATPGEPPAVP